MHWWWEFKTLHAQNEIFWHFLNRDKSRVKMWTCACVPKYLQRWFRNWCLQRLIQRKFCIRFVNVIHSTIPEICLQKNDVWKISQITKILSTQAVVQGPIAPSASSSRWRCIQKPCRRPSLRPQASSPQPQTAPAAPGSGHLWGGHRMDENPLDWTQSPPHYWDLGTPYLWLLPPRRGSCRSSPWWDVLSGDSLRWFSQGTEHIYLSGYQYICIFIKQSLS